MLYMLRLIPEPSESHPRLRDPQYVSWKDEETAKTLAEFFWRFDGMTDKQRGTDPTVGVVEESDVDAQKLIREHLAEYQFPASIRAEPPKLRIKGPWYTREPSYPSSRPSVFHGGTGNCGRECCQE